jgi:conjugal transfer pilus assembly protein TraE
MNRDYQITNMNSLRFQRNAFCAVSFLLCGTLFVGSAFLFTKRERVIVVPPVIEKSFWIDESGVSASYLEQQGLFMGQMLFNKNAGSATKQREFVLKNTSNSFLPVLKSKLIEEDERLTKQNTSYVFFMRNFEVYPGSFVVLIEGEKVFYVGGKMISTTREGYRLKFAYEGGRLLLDGIESVEAASV